QADRVFGLVQTERLTVLEAILAALLREVGERAWVLFENAAAADEYVQIMNHHGSLYGEVSSREWQEPLRPLTQETVVSLRDLGFTGGATERNFRRDGLPPDPARLALLVDSLFVAAYGPGSPQGVHIHSKGSEVTAALARLPY
ncbi:MAG: TY-Chap domain-containing protein, partial [Candidatus Dormibacteria bacterium]